MARSVKSKSDFRVMLVYPNLFMMLVPSLAMAIFTRLLTDEGYQVDLFETTHFLDEEGSSPMNRVKLSQARAFDYEKDLGVTVDKNDMFAAFRQHVLEFKPDVLLVSAVEDVFIQATHLLEAVEDLNIPHLVGGVFPTAAGERCLDFPVIQRIGRGEGEDIVLRFTENVRLGKSLDDIPGTWLRGEDGKIKKNLAPPLVNISAVEPDFRLFDAERFYRPMGGRIFKTVPVETYRGCPYACTFCNSPMQRSVAKSDGVGNFLRRKSMTDLRDELRNMVKSNTPELLYFIDDSFLARPKKEIFEFCDMYEEFKLPFWFNTRPENCHPDVLERIKEVGCYRISFGIECGNEAYRRKVLKRYVSNEQIIHSFADIRDSGIPFSVNLIIGFPGETRELIMDSIELVRSIDGYDSMTVSIFTPYHGTELRAVAVQNDWLDSKIITKHTTSRSLLDMPMPYVSADDIDGIAAVTPLYCYFDKSVWEQLRRAEADDEEGLAIRKHYQDEYAENFLGEDQDAEKVLVGGTGCRSNPKDSFRISPQRLTDAQLDSLVI